jgi:fructokinase
MASRSIGTHGHRQRRLDAHGTPTFTIHENAAWDLLERTRACCAKRPADAVCFGTLAQRNAVARAAIRAVLRATPPGALRIFDINLRQHFWSRELIVESLEVASVFKLNDEELPIVARLLGLAGDEPDLLRQIAERFGLKTLR